MPDNYSLLIKEEEIEMMKFVGWAVGIIFIIGLLVVFGVFKLIF
ncbi:MAG: hypothetical protein ABIR48_06280 [Gammaproteobacteria bacterium]